MTATVEAEAVTSHRRPRIGGALVVALIVLAALEGGVRLVADRLPVPLEWHSYETQRKVEQMDQRASKGADVVFLGTSMMNAAAVPALFDADVGGGVSSYNAALSSGTPLLMEAWATHVVLPRLHPKVVVIGVSSIDTTDNGVGHDSFFRAFEDSPGGRHALGNDDVLDHVDRWLGDHVALWRHRAELRDPMNVVDAIRGESPPQDAVAASMDAQGHLTNLEHQPFTETHKSGISGVSVWSLGTKELAALRRLIGTVQHGGGRVVLVDMPVTAEYIAMHPHTTADYDASKRAIAALARDEGVAHFDLDSPRDHALFADELHLDGDGANAFTHRLAAMMRSQGIVP